MTTYGYVEDTTSTYSSNTAATGAALLLSEGTQYSGTGIVFTSNTATYTGGAVAIARNSSLSCTTCTFTTNRADKGGGIYVESSASTVISSCTFNNN